MNHREHIIGEIEKFRARLRGSFPYEDKRIALLQFLRCIDNTTYTRYIYELARIEFPDKEFVDTVGRLFKWGWNEALSLFWSDDVNQHGIPLFQTDEFLQEWGDSLLQCAGRTRLIGLILELERTNLGKVVRSLQSDNTFEFHFSEDATGVESIEDRDGDYFKVLIGRMQKREKIWENLEKRRRSILTKMESLVGSFEQHYIRYDASPEVDEFYHDLSTAIAPTRSGWDAFPKETLFWGIPFAKYIECVRILIGFALKHLDFCVLLSNSDTAVRSIDIVALPCQWTDACAYMACALGITESESQQLMLATSITDENAVHHLSVPAGPMACHFHIGKGSAVRLITGCLDNPFHFLLRELHRKYPADWDKSVDSREHIFRRDLITLFSVYNRIVFFTDNINISTDIGKTDIDALAYDPFAKVAGLFQLKWQEPFAGSMRERESRKANLLKNGNAWVDKVSRWIKSGKMPQTLISLGMPKHNVKEISETRLFVLGRNFSHFSGEFRPDPRAAWGTWPQLLRLIETEIRGVSPLTEIGEKLRADVPTTRVPKKVRQEEITIPGLRITTHPPSHLKSEG